jgi:hypothetical protein
MGHFLTLQVSPTLKKIDLKMTLNAPKLFICSANIPNCQMQWYKKRQTGTYLQLILQLSDMFYHIKQMAIHS